MHPAISRPVRLAVDLLVVVALLAPATAVADWNEGKAALGRGDYATAFENFTLAVEHSPSYPWAHYMLGLALDGLDRRDEAIAGFERAFALDPANPTFAIGLGKMLVAEGAYQHVGEVLAAVDPGAATPADRVELAVLCANVALATGDPATAVRVANEALADRPDDVALLHALGRGYELDEHPGLAYHAYLRAWRLDPAAVENGRDAVRTGLAAAQATAEADRAAAYGELAPLAAEVAEAAPDHASAVAAGECWLGAKRFGDAATWFENARLLAPDDPLTLYYCGLVLRCRDHADEAREDLEAALAHGADAALAAGIHAELARLAEVRLDLPAAIRHHRLAGEDARAAELDALRGQFKEVLDSRGKLAAELTELRTMQRQLAELGEADGVSQFEAKIAQYEAEIGRVDTNLDQVRLALAGNRLACK